MLICFAFDVYAQTKNGFDLSNASIKYEEIFSGGPPRDGIPSIDKPKFIDISQVDFLQDDDIVIGLVRADKARAYPSRILVWHEIVNDIIDGEAVVVTYCPLCGTAMVFDRHIAGKLHTFGVSGLLYQSDVLMYDRESESLWSQLAMKSVSGSELGNKLFWLPSEHLTWKAWREKYPDGEVLSTDTGHNRNYSSAAYSSYFASDQTMFPVRYTRKELSKKVWVIGVIINGQAKAYAVNKLSVNSVIKDNLGNQKITIKYDAERKHHQIMNQQGEQIPSVLVFWFAWQAFYPQTQLWNP
ncbi:MAG: DUF3179 domain-containing protein [gamma proteobacterium symbiont of Taylorina sp.]|nr:DUF3179 domain-containing protein [gamma proteobacterium symbiont of Taylorina sp.]